MAVAVQTCRSSHAKKVKYFDKSWELLFMCQNTGTRIRCLLCDQLLQVKKHNIKKHYETKHLSDYVDVVGEERRELLRSLKEKFPLSTNNPENESAGSSDTRDKEDNVGISAPSSSKAGVNALSQAVQALQEISNQNCTLNEFQTFGQHIAAQLEQLPLKDALELETDIIGLITARRMKLLKENESAENVAYGQVETIDIKPEIVPHM